MKKLLLLLIVGGAGFVLLALMGHINVPGLTPPVSSTPQVEKLEPPKEKPLEKTTPKDEPKKETPKTAPTPEAKKIEPPAKKSLYPPILPADVERARVLYMKADWTGVGRSLEGCEKPEIEDGPSTQSARGLVRKARLLDVLTQTFKRNAIATAKKLEQISLDNGRPMIGVVREIAGDRLEIFRIGNVKVEVKMDEVRERTPVARTALRDQLLERLKEKESRIKGDDGFGNVRLGHYCWEYGLDVEAVPYLDKAVESDDFPVLAKVFGGSNAQKLVDGWYVFSGKSPRGEGPKTNEVATTPTKPVEPTKPSQPVSATGNFGKAKAKYDAGVEKYKDSFGDSGVATSNLKAAHELFKQARDALGDAEDPASDELRTQISRLIYDCSKRSAIN